MTYDLPFDDAYEPYHASSPTDRVILELQMYGHRPHQDEPDPAAAARRDGDPRRPCRRSSRPSPACSATPGSNPTSKTCSGRPPISSTAPPSASPATSIATRRRSVRASSEQDGSEVKSVELERLTAEGITLCRAPQRPSRSCATRRPTCSRRIPDRHGGRAPARRSTIRR